MSTNRVFFPQQTLDEWLAQGRIALVDDELTVIAAGRRFRLTTALHFTAEVADTADAHDLVGKVKTLEQILALSGEHCADSVILGDNAYQVVEGFIGEVLPSTAAAVKKSKAGKRNTRSSLAPEPEAFSRLLERL